MQAPFKVKVFEPCHLRRLHKYVLIMYCLSVRQRIAEIKETKNRKGHFVDGERDDLATLLMIEFSLKQLFPKYSKLKPKGTPIQSLKTTQQVVKDQIRR